MKKILLIITSVVFLSSNAFSQYKLKKGDAQINAGAGFSTWGIPVYAGVDFGVHRFISAGGEVSFRSYIDSYKDRQNVLGVSGNGNFHFSGLLRLPDKYDIYVGLNLGFFYRSNSSGITSAGYGGVGAQVGGRYYLSKHFGLNLELGGSNIFDWGKMGISYVF